VNGLSPQFFPTQKVTFVSDDGQQSATVLEVVSVSPSPFKITLSGIPPFENGSIIADVSDSSYPGVHNYQIGRHVTVDLETGQIKNSQLAPPAGPTEVLVGNELLDSSITFSNSDTSPKRIPSLDGSIYNDFGFSSRPQLTYLNEMDLLSREKLSYNYFGTAVVSAINTVTSSTVSVVVGQSIYFLDGLNSGSYHVVDTIGPALGQFTVIPNFSLVDLTARSMFIVSPSGNVFDIISDELDIVKNNQVADPVYYIGTLNSQILSSEKCISDSSVLIVSGTATVNVDLVTMTDTGTNFTSLIDDVDGSYAVLISTESNRGVYGVASVSNNDLNILYTDPYSPFKITGEVSYELFKLESIVPNESIGILSSIVSKGIEFFGSTYSWSTFLSSGGISTRVSDILLRESDLSDFVSNIESLLGKSGKLYDGRFLWIAQRVDKKSGLLSKTMRAKQDRKDSELKIVEDQKKLLSVQSL